MESGRGGNRHPIATKEFIAEYLRENGPSPAVDVFHAYKKELTRLSGERELAFQQMQDAKLKRLKELNKKPPPGRRKSKLRPYVPATYNSFMVQLWGLVHDEKIARMDEVEPSLAPQFRGKEVTRLIFRLGGPSQSRRGI